MITQATRTLLSGGSLTRAEAAAVMDAIVAQEATPSQIAAFLTALRMKGESPDEVAGFAEAMRAHAIAVPGTWSALLDTCGTGGDASGTFNISTTVAFVAAACGVSVAKHGNRSASSQCGSADVLEALGINIDLSPDHAARCLEEHGLTFLFAPRFHPSMKHVGAIRKELGFPTVFNLLGPLSNPLKPDYQVLGVYKAEFVDLMVQALKALGTRRAVVVHGHGGLDELSLEGPSQVAELREDGTIRRYEADPRSVGLQSAPKSALSGGDAPTNARLIEDILSGILRDARRDAVLWNAAAALVVAGVSPDLADGVRRAADAIDGGGARRTLESFRARTRSI